MEGGNGGDKLKKNRKKTVGIASSCGEHCRGGHISGLLLETANTLELTSVEVHG